MQDHLEQLEAEVIDAFQSQREQERRHHTVLGLIPGEPVAGGELDRAELEEPMVA